MSVTRRGTEFAKVIAYDRHLTSYYLGGNWDPFNRTRPTDCSGCVVDVLDAALNGPAMAWTRHGLWTESWRPPNLNHGKADPHNGPFGTVMVDDPSHFPANAAVLIALHHGNGTAEDSHMWCQVDNLKIETHGSRNDYPHGATVLNDGVNYSDDVRDVRDTEYANNWWYLPGPIIEDGTPQCTGPSDPNAAPGRLIAAPDTLFADISQFQQVVTDAYTNATYSDRGQNWPYRWISIRSNDGSYPDKHFADNYSWCVKAVNDGRLEGFSVYYFWRPNPTAVHTHIKLISDAGGPHPRMNSEVDVETGNAEYPNPAYDVSSQINSDVDTLAAWYGGNRARVIGYGNCNDINTMWPTRPPGLLMRYAGYGRNPDKPDQVAHQYKDDKDYGDGLPDGVAPFGKCDMNSADNLSPAQFAAKLGLAAAPAPVPPSVPTTKPTPTPANPTYPPFLDGLSDRQVLNLIAVQLLGPDGTGWPQGGADQQAIAHLNATVAAGGNLTPTEIICWLKQHWQGTGLGGPQ